MPPAPRPIVLSIAGFDPSSGAGVTADIKTIATHGCYGVSAITALTVQSTQGVKSVEAVSASVLADTLAELDRDCDIQAIRIGMLGNGKLAKAVAAFLTAKPRRNVVLDPIFKASSGADLLDPAGTAVLRDQILKLADVITPNVDEAAALTSMSVASGQEMRAAADRLHEMGARGVIITGGHLAKPLDLLSTGVGPTNKQELMSEKLRSTSTHGTGCAFATALACQLAHGKQLADAAVLAKAYVRRAIAEAYPVGKGTGPVNHLYRMDVTGRPLSDAPGFEPKH